MGTSVWVMAALAMVSPQRPAVPMPSVWAGPEAVAVVGNVRLELTVDPTGPQLPGSELTYAMRYRNLGTKSIANIVILDRVPDHTQFKVGSAQIGTPPPSVASITPQYSSDGGATWTYVPMSGGGGAPPSFDANVTHVRFLLVGLLHSGIVPTVGVSFTVRIRD
ncbi:MAG TPA: hypothetical protein VFT13_09275 [Candidatus Krumholzibacteria bacterium]|nr:hypothetical protein [Candidatus Krumholzibacteria bacterium]